jgi:hypothetical protein
MSALSLSRPIDAQRRNSPPVPVAKAAQAPDPMTTSRIPIVRMSSVSVPEACLKNRLGITTIATPTQMRAAATVASADVPTEFRRAIPQTLAT